MAGIGTEPDRAHGQGLTTAREQRAPRRPGVQTRGAWLTLAAGIAAALPVIAATIEGLREGATPTGDRAIILTRSYDVFSSHTPLVGQFSASSLLYDHIVNSLGPMLYWLLAVPVRLGAAVPPALAIAAVNALAILAAVALARRRGGIPLMMAAAVALALMCGSLAPETWHDVWNPSAALLPFTLLIFVCWSLACGERRLLPPAVVLASFAAQGELVYVAPSAVVLALGVAGLVGSPAGRRSAWRWWLGALVAGLVCWSAPVVDELRGHPGNLTLVAEAAFSHGHTVGAQAGWRALVHAVGIPPWWLTAPHDPFGRLADVRATAGRLASISCVTLLAALLAVLALGVWRRRRELAWAAAIGLALCFGLVGVTASMSSRPSLENSLGYMLWVGSPVGMWVWLTLAVAAATLLAPALLTALARTGLARATSGGRIHTHAALASASHRTVARDRPPRATARLRGAALAGLGAAIAAGAAVAAGQGPDQDRLEYGPVKLVQAAVRKALVHGPRTVLVTGSHRFTAFDFRAAVIYDLRRRGWRVFAPAASERLGAWYEPPGDRALTTMWVFDEPRPPSRGRVIARVRFGAAPRKTITVTISRAARRSSTATARRPLTRRAPLRGASAR